MSYANLSANSAHTQLPESVQNVDSKGVVETWLAGRSAKTARAYKGDVTRFATWLGVPTVDEAARLLLGRDSAAANRLALSYMAKLRTEGLAPATINRAVAALRSLAKTGRLIGYSDATIDVPTARVVRPKPRTPEAADVRRMLAELEADPSPLACRNRAVLMLLAVHGLRRAEVSGLDLGDYDGQAVSIRGKGRSGQRERIALHESVAAAIDAWIAVRTQHAETDAVFVCLTGRNAFQRLHGEGIYSALRTLGKRIGWDGLRPHLLRRFAITAALDANGGDVRAAQAFARHADPGMTLHYDSQRRDLHAQGAAAVGAALLG